MDVLQAIFLGIVEGLTEFLPISSTGHLILAEHFMKFEDAAKLFTVVVQLGATCAAIWYFRNDITDKISKFFKGDKVARHFIKVLIVAIIPAGLLGLALDKSFEKYATAGVVAVAMIVGGVILWLADRRPQAETDHNKLELEKVSVKQALIVGLAQCVALIPGTSRSGATIVGGLFGGLNRLTATTFSFYAGIPILLAASAYKLVKDADQLSSITGGSTGLLLGTIASFISGLFAVSWLLRYVSTHNLRIFAYYRIIVGIIVLLVVR